MRALVVAAVLAGCSGGDDVPDATPIDAGPADAPGDWEGDFFWRVDVRPQLEQTLPEVRIAGTPQTSYEAHFAGEDGARGVTIVVETYVNGRFADRVELAQLCDEFPWVYYGIEESIGAFTSGELRRVQTTCATEPGGGGWHTDWFYEPCWPPCADGTHCGLERVDGDPTHGWRDCVPALGERAAGETCTIDDEGHDDCAAGAYCVDGTCRAACGVYGDDIECPGEVCDQVPGMSPDVLACLPT